MSTERREEDAPKVHELKTWTEYFEAVCRGEKTFEIRFNDRGFKRGDTLILREYERFTGHYTGREATVRVSYVSEFEQKPGYVVLGIQPTIRRFDCEDCGRDVRVDEDWCCLMCGSDTTPVDMPPLWRGAKSPAARDSKESSDEVGR